MRYSGPIPALQNDKWMLTWRSWVDSIITSLFGVRVSVGVLLLGPALLVSIVLYLIGDWFFYLVEFALSIIVLLYACARGDYESFVFRYQGALSRKDHSALLAISKERCNAGSNVLDDGAAASVTSQYLNTREQIAYWGYDRWFGAAFWFLILGVPGALFYRCVALVAFECLDKEPYAAATNQDSQGEYADVVDKAIEGESEYVQYAAAIIGWLDWLPARIWSFSFAIVGHFGQAFTVLNENLLRIASNQQLIDEVSVAAVSDKADIVVLGDEVDLDAASQEIESLFEANNRVMFVTLVFAVLAVVIF